jgi:cytochrome c oxidase subunit 2
MPASPVMEGIMNFHHDVFFFMVIVVIFVSFLLYRVIEDYNSETNKIPLIVTHSANLEII